MCADSGKCLSSLNAFILCGTPFHRDARGRFVNQAGTASDHLVSARVPAFFSPVVHRKLQFRCCSHHGERSEQGGIQGRAAGAARKGYLSGGRLFLVEAVENGVDPSCTSGTLTVHDA